MMCQSFLGEGLKMQFTVSFVAGVYHFLVESTEPGVDYEEEFELADVNEAKMTARELIEEIAQDDEDFGEDVWGDPRED